MNFAKRSVFLDSNVLLQYLRGKPEISELFDPETEKRVTYAVNPVVLQELLLAQESLDREADLDALAEHFTIVSSEAIFDAEVLKTLRELLRKRLHPNDMLILGSAQRCDFLLTYDKVLLGLDSKVRVPIKTPEEFLANLGADA